MHFRFAALGAGLLFSLSPLLAKADTYSVTSPWPSTGAFFVAADNHGDYILEFGRSSSAICNDPTATVCFETYTAATKSTAVSEKQPTLPYPSYAYGSAPACAAAPAWANAAFCSNGHTYYSTNGYDPSIDLYTGLYFGTDPATDRIPGAPPILQGQILTPNGDLFYFTGQSLQILRDLTTDTPAPTTGVTPEPSSLALLGTGLLAIAGVRRRRMTPLP